MLVVLSILSPNSSCDVCLLIAANPSADTEQKSHFPLAGKGFRGEGWISHFPYLGFGFGEGWQPVIYAPKGGGGEWAAGEGEIIYVKREWMACVSATLDMFLAATGNPLPLKGGGGFFWVAARNISVLWDLKNKSLYRFSPQIVWHKILQQFEPLVADEKKVAVGHVELSSLCFLSDVRGWMRQHRHSQIPPEFSFECLLYTR